MTPKCGRYLTPLIPISFLLACQGVPQPPVGGAKPFADLSFPLTDAGLPAVDLAMPAAPNFLDVIQPLMTAHNCFGCHMTDAWDLHIIAANPGAARQSALTTTVAVQCPTPFVVPGDPEASYMFQKMRGSGSCFTGARMPSQGTPLGDRELQEVADWITAGAPIN
jgi:hypothetical protein